MIFPTLNWRFKQTSARGEQGLKNGSEILRVMDDANLISAKDTRFLEHLLMRIGRNDLYETIQNYHLKRGLSDDSKAGLTNCMLRITPKQLIVIHRRDCHTDADCVSYSTALTVLSTSFGKSFFAWRCTQKK